MKKEAILNCFFDAVEEDLNDRTMSDWIEEQGYGGALYACYEEFLNTEFLDMDYMEYLLNGTEILDDYDSLVKEEAEE